MSNLSQFLGGGGGAGAPVNAVAELGVGGVTQFTDASGGEWLKTGSVITSNFANYPDAIVKTRPDLSSVSYDTVTGTLNGQSPIKYIKFHPDGTRVYGFNSSDNYLYQWDLATAWDLSTISASNTGSYNIGGNFATPIAGFDITKDGKFLYVANSSSYAKGFGVAELNTAWNISSVNNNLKTNYGVEMEYYFGAWFDTSSSATVSWPTPSDIKLSKDDSKLYVLYNNNMIAQFKAPNKAGYGIGNSSFELESFIGVNTSFPIGIDPNNERIYYSDTGARTREFDVNPDDISSLKYTGNLTTTLYNTLGTFPIIAFKSYSTKMYALAQNTNTIYQFSITPEQYIGVPYKISSNSYLKIK